MRVLVLLISLCAALLLAANLQAENYWQQVSGPYGGNINSVAIGSNDEILAATGGAGLYKSVDNGAHWLSLPIKNGSKNILSVMFDSKGEIFVISSEFGIFKSKDAGVSWTNLKNGLDSVYFYSSRYSRIFESSDGTLYFANDDGVWRSDDFGDNWTRKSWKYDIYTNLCSFAINKAGTIFYSTPEAVLISSDKGDTWIAKDSVSDLSWYHSMVLANNGDIILTTEVGYFKSTDNGNNWSKIHNPLDSNYSIKYMDLDKQGNIYVAAQGNGIFISKDDGDSWMLTGEEAGNFTVNSIGFNSKHDILLGTSTGVYISNDECKHFEYKNHGINNTSISKMAKNEKGDIFVIATGKAYRTSDKGLNWTDLAGDINEYRIQYLMARGSNKIYAATDNNFYSSRRKAILFSSNNGDSWQKISQNLKDTLFTSFEAGENGYVYAGTSKNLYRTADNGQNWVSVNPVAPDTAWIFSLCINQKGEIYAGVNSYSSSKEYCLYKSVDNGNTWSKISTFGLNFSIAINEQNEIFILFINFDNQITQFQSTIDDGKTWLSYWKIGKTFMSYKNVIWIGTSFTIDDGKTWVDLSKGIEGRQVNNILAVDSNITWAGTADGGIFQTAFKPENAKILYIKAEPSDLITLDLEQSVNITVTPLDKNNKPVPNSRIFVADSLAGSSDTLTLDNEGMAMYQTKVPYERINGYYPVVFTASNKEFINECSTMVNVLVNHIDTLSLFIEPKDTQVIYTEDWIPSVEYTVMVTDSRKHFIQSASIKVEDELKGLKTEVMSFPDGIAYYTTDMEHVKPEGVYQIKFKSSKQDFVNSDSVTRYIRVKSGANDVKQTKPTDSRMNLHDLIISPNPIITKAKIGFNLDAPSNIKISIRDLLGNEVLKLADGFYPAGYNEIEINCEKLSSQIYFVIMESGGSRDVKGLVIQK